MASAGELVGCWKSYSFNAAGWHRIAEINCGSTFSFSCEISIKSTFVNNNNECHKVMLISVASNGVFKSIYDKSNALLFRKIRCVKVGENYGTKHYIDIYYESTANNVASITIGDNRNSQNICWNIIEKTIVPETAGGETTLAIMDFGSNTWLGNPL